MEIQEIKSRLSILNVLGHYNVKTDKNNRALCPFHNDKTPSLQVYPQTNTWSCFSTNCVAGSGDQIHFIQLMENRHTSADSTQAKHEAITKAAAMLTGSFLPEITIPKQTTVPTLERFTKAAILTKMFSVFKNTLDSSKPARDYLTNRSLDFTKTEAGYNDGDFFQGVRKEALIKSCLQAGLLTETTSKGKDKAYRVFGKWCVVFALRNKQSQVTGLYFRSTVNDQEQKHYYLKDREGLYPCYPEPGTKKIILTESVIDAATLLQIPSINSQYSILAAYGTNGLTEEHTEAISQLKQLEEIIFAFDTDDAGKAAVEKCSKQLYELLPQAAISTLELPCKDVNETLQAHSEEVFTHLLEQRNFLFSIEKEKQSTGQQISKISNRLNTTNSDQIHYNTSELSVTLLGGVSLQYLDRLRVTLYIRRNPHLSPVYSIRQTIDLYHHDALEKFTRQASEKTDISTTHITETLAALTEELEQYRLRELEKKKAISKKKPRKELSAQEKKQALENLKQQDLLSWTMQTLLCTGIIGEKENAGILFYGMVSRLLENPVSVITLSSSGTGKSYLMERIAQCFPPDTVIENTHLTDNSLYYFRQDELKHKIMLIEDMDGAQNVEYAIRELISKKYITKTAVRKDSKGQLFTEQYRVEGPVAFFGCTTRENLYEDNSNRVIPVYLNTGKEQDGAIMYYQKEVKAGIVDTRKEEQIREHLQNMQLLLKPCKVINPYATLIDLPAHVFKPRRTLGILFSFIEAITLYHQYQASQEEHKAKGYLQAEPQHIEYAFSLLKETLFRKSDELSASVRNFLDQVKVFLRKEKKQSFYANEIRKPLHLHPRTLRKYLYELHQFGYIKIAGGNRYRKGFEYELTGQGKEETLKSDIDRHIEDMMKKIWDRYNQDKKREEGTSGN